MEQRNLKVKSTGNVRKIFNAFPVIETLGRPGLLYTREPNQISSRVAYLIKKGE